MTDQEVKNELESISSLQKFYAGQNVLITGGTGYLGKLLIQKLLRSCPYVSTIYLVIRPKKGQDSHQRLESILEDPVFNRLKNEVPKFRHKLVVIPGDCSYPEFNLSVEDKQLLMREISIVFNVAATVRFDEKLKGAITTNINCAKEMMNLCRKMTNLKSAVHVSTAYSNCTEPNIEEKIYKPPITGDQALKLIKSLDEEKLDAITTTLLGKFPNTYTYTKCIAEQVIQQYGKELPTGIFRPSIVTASYEDPVPGWVGNYYGPTGLVAATGLGLMRTVRVDEDGTAQIVPSDFVINALIATAWDIANNKNQDADPLVYNFTTWSNIITWRDFFRISLIHGKKVPSNHSIWTYSLTVTKNLYLYYFLIFFLHLLPGYIVDAGLFITGKKPRLVKIYKKIHNYSSITSYFCTFTWKFAFNNTKMLWEKLTPEDQSIFNFSMDNLDWTTYLERSIEGTRFFIFKEDPVTIPAARKRMSRILLLNNLLKCTFAGLLMWLLYLIISYTLSLGTRSNLTTISESIITH